MTSEANTQTLVPGWQQVTVAGKTVDVFEPARPGSLPAAVLFLHGHGRITLRDNAAYTRELEQYGLRCVCPWGERCWWADRICREFDEGRTPVEFLRRDLLSWIAETWKIQPPAIALLGASMGGQGVLRLAYRSPREFPVVAALAPALDMHLVHGRGLPLDEIYPTAEEARQESATLWIHPLNWPRHQFLACDPRDAEAFDSTERLASKLSSTGIPFESDLRTRGGGHSWEYFNRMAPAVMRFLSERLLAESRRLDVV